jgi:hypothetical protein
MYMTYRMNAAELDSRFLRALKAMFNGRDVEIVSVRRLRVRKMKLPIC